MIIYGVNPVKDLFNKDRSKLVKVWVQKKRHQSFYNDLVAAGIKVLDIADLNYRSVELTGKETIQGIVAQIEEPKLFSLNELIDINKDNQESKIIILDHIEDPQNFGAIIRNAAAFEVDGIIYPSRGAAKLNSTVMKTSAGNWMNVNLCEVNSLNSVVETLKENGYWIVSTSLEGTNTLQEIKDMNRPLAIVFGNEGKGVKKSIQDKSDFKVKLNMSEKVESLNVSSSVSIILHSLYKD